MKKVFYSNWFARNFLPCAHTITIGPFVLTKRDELPQSVINHECTHSRQWIELTLAIGILLWLLLLLFDISAWWMVLSIVFFYIWYGVEYIVRLCIMRSHKKAYKAVCFEQEARESEDNDNYLENAHYFSWIKFLKL